MVIFCFLCYSFYSSPDNNTCPLVFRGNYIHVKATINYEDAKSILNLAICSSPSLLLFFAFMLNPSGFACNKLQISKSHLPPSSSGIKMSCRLFYFERIPFKEIILQEAEQLKQAVPYSPFSISFEIFCRRKPSPRMQYVYSALGVLRAQMGFKQAPLPCRLRSTLKEHICLNTCPTLILLVFWLQK